MAFLELLPSGAVVLGKEFLNIREVEGIVFGIELQNLLLDTLMCVKISVSDGDCRVLTRH